MEKEEVSLVWLKELKQMEGMEPFCGGPTASGTGSSSSSSKGRGTGRGSTTRGSRSAGEGETGRECESETGLWAGHGRVLGHELEHELGHELGRA